MPQKTVLITGCSEGGIGAALAEEFQLQGCKVFATARNVAKMSTLAEKGIETLELDVNSDESIAAAVATVQQATGGSLDFLINNAGVNHPLPFTDMTIAEVRSVLNTNIVGVFTVTHALLPLLIQAKGLVATIGSVNEVFCPPFQSPYNASKAAVHAMGSTLRKELAPFGVRFVTVVTGAVRSKLFDNSPTVVPEDSLYRPIGKVVEEREFIRGAQWVDADEYARQVVGDLLRPKPRDVLWRGGLATVGWLFSWLGWEGMLDSSIIKSNKLDTLAR
ncbi:short-chain dehydrogenase/reductase [Xylariales sp. PMI_506]|nr:short-chain dehydrogenase/reductase [Xylariales sp. PMI_506]